MRRSLITLFLIGCALYLRAEFGTRSAGGGISSETDPIFTSSAPLTYVNKNEQLGIGKVGETIVERIAIWAGAETTTTSGSYGAKAFRVLKLNSGDYALSGSSLTVVFRVIVSSASVDLYDHTAGATIAGSELVNDSTYSSIPTTANISQVEIPLANFPSSESIVSVRIKSTTGVTAKLAEAALLLKYRKE